MDTVPRPQALLDTNRGLVNRSLHLTKLSSSQAIGWGFSLIGLGGALLSWAIPASLQPDAKDTPTLLAVIAGLAVLAGWVTLAIGFTRQAAKVDDLHRLFVDSHVETTDAEPQGITTPAGDSGEAVPQAS